MALQLRGSVWFVAEGLSWWGSGRRLLGLSALPGRSDETHCLPGRLPRGLYYVYGFRALRASTVTALGYAVRLVVLTWLRLVRSPVS